MLGYFKDFIVNIFFIFSPLVFYPYIYRTKSNILLFRFLLYILFSFALIATMSFPISINGLIYDFRSIPLAVGSLYGGIPILILLYVTIILYRYCMGSPHDLIYAFSLIPSLIIVMYSLRLYPSLRLYQKIILSIILSSIIKLSILHNSVFDLKREKTNNLRAIA
jgi:two-component system, sporulation sensor kinase B